jgi:drug/metabolite transporter (DMT)-like permease
MSEFGALQGSKKFRPPDYVGLGAFALLVLLGGANPVAVRFSNAELPPFWGAAIRFMAAATFFWVIVLVRRCPLPGGRTLMGFLLYGILQFGVSYAFYYWGILHMQAGVAQTIIALVPLLTVFFAFAHRVEPFRWWGLIGALLAVGGIALAFMGQPQTGIPLVSILSMIAAAACIAEAGVVVKSLTALAPFVINALAMSVGALTLLAFSLAAHERWQLPASPQTWAAVLYLTVVGSVILFYLFLIVVKRWSVSTISYQFVLLPFVTVILGALLAGETVTPSFIFGSVLVVLGVWVGAIVRVGHKADSGLSS